MVGVEANVVSETVAVAAAAVPVPVGGVAVRVVAAGVAVAVAAAKTEERGADQQDPIRHPRCLGRRLIGEVGQGWVRSD